jgi:DNA-binding Xre family transcriptional regulator
MLWRVIEMTNVPTAWRLSEVMSRHRVTNKELSDYMDVRAATVSDMRRSVTLPKIGGEKLDELAAAVTALSKIGETIRGIDLLEDRPE